jgi:hypothetical protein
MGIPPSFEIGAEYFFGLIAGCKPRMAARSKQVTRSPLSAADLYDWRLKDAMRFNSHRHREEAEGQRGDPGVAGRPSFPWIASLRSQ